MREQVLRVGLTAALILVLSVVNILAGESSTVAHKAPAVIFDTDMGSDCDDAGALAVLHALADAGEARILGVIFSSAKNRYGVGTCDAINTWYGRGDLPLGQYKGDDVGDPTDSYTKRIATDTKLFGHDVVEEAPDLVDVYRDILESQPNKSVTIITVGHPHAIVHLMRDPQAMKLLLAKVNRWIAMGTGGWNLQKMGMSAYSEELLKKWPLPLYISPRGADIKTGNKLLPKTPKINPVREAYRLWGDKTALTKGRSSWDQVAVLYAFRPGLFELVHKGRLERKPNAEVVWNANVDNPKHHLVKPKVSTEEITRIIEELMACPPRSRVTQAKMNARIQPWSKNPYYWTYKGKPVLLLGGSSEDNLFQVPNLTEELDKLAKAGGNYVRCTMSWRDEGNVMQFKRKGDRYDLQQWNPEFWNRFEHFLQETAKRDIIVQIEVWATFDYYQSRWDLNPFNPKNNVNYSREASGLPLQVNSHPVLKQNDFFRSVPKAKNLEMVLSYQERFVEKILEHSLKYDHVLYCMDNETSVTPEWGKYWSEFIKRKAAVAGKKVETTEMWDPWSLDNPKHANTFDHPETYSFVDISQNNHQKGQKHYDNALKQRRRIAHNPRPMNNVKTYGSNSRRFGASKDGVERFWRSIFAGCAAVRFHRPDAGIGCSAKALRMISSAREVTDAIDIVHCTPRPDLLTERSSNEAYCLARDKSCYAVLFLDGGDVTLNLEGKESNPAVRFYNVQNGKWSKTKTESVSNRVLHLKTPGKGPWVAMIKMK